MSNRKVSLQGYVDPKLKQRVLTEGEKNNRSQSQEIEYALEQHYRRKK